MKKWECTVCGYIHEGDEPPDECPVCGAARSAFTETGEGAAQDAAAGGEAREEQEPGTEAEKENLSAPGQEEASSPARSTFYDKISGLIVRRHLHPIAVHTPNGVAPMAVLFLFIAALFKLPFFETAAFYSLVFTLVAMPFVLFTGYATWKTRFRGALTSVFKIKIAASILVSLCLLILIGWRIIQPSIVLFASQNSWIYLGVAVLLVLAAALAGHLGGKLTFGAQKK